MRALLLATMLAATAALGAAAAEPGPGACTAAGCVRTADTDDDGDLDWVSVASGAEPYALNVIWRNESELWYETIAHTDDHDETYLAVWSSGHAHTGHDHVHADGAAAVMEAEPATGETHDYVWIFFGLEVPGHLPHLP